VEARPQLTRVQELVYELRVAQAMTGEVVTVTPQTRVSEFREILRINRISGTPVVEHGELVGIMSIEDLIKALAKGEIEATVGEKMTREVRTLYADAPLIQAIGQFTRYGFGRFPVVDRRGKLVGILTQGDVIQVALQELEIEYHEEEIHRYRASHIFEDIIADRTSLRFEYDVLSKDFNRAGMAASGLKRTLGRLGISPQIIRRVSITAYEAEMNIVIFTEGGQLIAEVTPDRIQIEAIDHGPGIPDIKKAMQPGFSTAPAWVREMGFGAGMGLKNIQACSDEMDLQSKEGEGTHVTAIIYPDKGE
jgi:CBS domain-containing protein/anti-sigma regulatory factor (Ser/Thr protein kinase)